MNAIQYFVNILKRIGLNKQTQNQFTFFLGNAKFDASIVSKVHRFFYQIGSNYLNCSFNYTVFKQSLGNFDLNILLRGVLQFHVKSVIFEIFWSHSVERREIHCQTNFFPVKPFHME